MPSNLDELRQRILRGEAYSKEELREAINQLRGERIAIAEKATEKAPEKATEKLAEKPRDRAPERAPEKPHEKPAEKATEKATEKLVAKPAAKKIPAAADSGRKLVPFPKRAASQPDSAPNLPA